jgi:very-short-patch-repair endonuclease
MGRSGSHSGADKHAIGNKSLPDRVIATLAASQHGVVAARQLSLSRSALAHRVDRGSLHRVHQGVYAVGHLRLTREGRWMAAVLAYGPQALLSHRTAAALWNIGAGASQIEVSTPSCRHRRPGIRTHRAPLHAEDHGICHGIPVTSVARTILDLSAVLKTEDRLARVVEDADRLQLFDLNALNRAIDRRPQARGARRLRAVMADYQGAEDTRSGLERDFLALIRRAKLPPPQVNVLVAGVLVDVHWPAWALVVELDGRTFHSSPRAFERDRIRDATLQKHGYRVLRITRKRLAHDPTSVLQDVLALARPLPG